MISLEKRALKNLSSMGRNSNISNISSTGSERFWASVYIIYTVNEKSALWSCIDWPTLVRFCGQIVWLNRKITFAIFFGYSDTYLLLLHSSSLSSRKRSVWAINRYCFIWRLLVFCFTAALRNPLRSQRSNFFVLSQRQKGQTGLCFSVLSFFCDLINKELTWKTLKSLISTCEWICVLDM